MSHRMQVRSREPLTIIPWTSDTARHVTASVWPYSGCRGRFRLSQCFCECWLLWNVGHAGLLTCLSFMWTSLSLLTATSHTHTTVLSPAVTTVVGLGQAAHSVSPQSHRHSHTAKIYKERHTHDTVIIHYVEGRFRYSNFFLSDR